MQGSRFEGKGKGRMNPRGKKKVPAASRRQQILDMLQHQPMVSIEELVEEFNVSAVSIRSDLNDLARQGLVARTHGGAGSAGRMVFANYYENRRRVRNHQKQAIAREAIKLVRPGDRLLLDTGTTMLCLAEYLKDLRDIVVITSSLAVAAVLQYAEGVTETLLLGGRLTRGRMELTGILTETGLDIFAGDITFQGAAGVGLDGELYAPDMSIARVNQKMRSRSDRKYVLADSSKIGKTALVRHGSLSEFDAFYTDAGIDPKHKQELEQLGVPIVVAPL